MVTLTKFFCRYLLRDGTQTSPFHLPIGEMNITLDDVSCILHLPMIGILLDHSLIQRSESLYLLIS